MLQAGTSSAEELNEAHKRVDHYNAWALDAEVYTELKGCTCWQVFKQDGKHVLREQQVSRHHAG